MATRHTSNLANGTIDADGGVFRYQTANSFEMGACEPGVLSMSPYLLPSTVPVCTIWLSHLDDDDLL